MKSKLAPWLLALFAALAFGNAVAEEPASPAATPSQRVDVRQRRIDTLMQRYEQVGVTPEQKNRLRRQARAKAIIENYRNQIGEVLTVEQKTQLEQMRIANQKAAQAAGVQKRKARPADGNDDD
jgi:hypothetical protein